MDKDLKYIYTLQEEVGHLNGINALLDFDEKTRMPRAAIEERASQAQVIHDLVFDKVTSKKLYSTLLRLKKKRLSKKDALVVKELYKDVLKIRKIPKTFMQKLIHTSVIASETWQIAREKDNFNIFKPTLKKLISLKRKQAGYLNPKVSPYDALLDEFEEGMTSERLTIIFEELKKGLVMLLKKIKLTKAYKAQKKIKTNLSEDKQKLLVYDMMSKMGMEPERSALDTSTHPFTLRVSENDVRITTRYNDPTESFLAGVHEAGHALYELGLPKRYAKTIIYNAPSIGLHESQSRFWENMVARSRTFWSTYFRNFQRYMEKAMTAQKFYTQINQVKPSFIRVDADEVTYCLHIILRFEIERDLMNGKLNIENAKKEWNRKFKEMFGITPKTDNQGILQDVHWSMGAFGYFPTYAIGTIYASQLFNKMQKDIPNLNKLISSQKFTPILKWLRRNIHEKGKTMLADDIIKRATGKGLDPQHYLGYLTEKYSKIYGF